MEFSSFYMRILLCISPPSHLLRNCRGYRTLDQISYKTTPCPCLLFLITRCISMLYILWAFIISLSQSQSLTFGFKSFHHQATDRVIIPTSSFHPVSALNVSTQLWAFSCFQPQKLWSNPPSAQNSSHCSLLLIPWWFFFSSLPSSVRGNWGTTGIGVFPKENIFLALTRKSFFSMNNTILRHFTFVHF